MHVDADGCQDCKHAWQSVGSEEAAASACSYPLGRRKAVRQGKTRPQQALAVQRFVPKVNERPPIWVDRRAEDAQLARRLGEFVLRAIENLDPLIGLPGGAGHPTSKLRPSARLGKGILSPLMTICAPCRVCSPLHSHLRRGACACLRAAICALCYVSWDARSPMNG